MGRAFVCWVKSCLSPEYLHHMLSSTKSFTPSKLIHGWCGPDSRHINAAQNASNFLSTNYFNRFIKTSVPCWAWSVSFLSSPLNLPFMECSDRHGWRRIEHTNVKCLPIFGCRCSGYLEYAADSALPWAKNTRTALYTGEGVGVSELDAYGWPSQWDAGRVSRYRL